MLAHVQCRVRWHAWGSRCIAHQGVCTHLADDIIITAVVLRKWKPSVAGMRCEVVLALLANHVQVLNERKCNVNLSPEESQNFKVSGLVGLQQPCQWSPDVQT
jgi:hypothetical protein